MKAEDVAKLGTQEILTRKALSISTKGNELVT